MKIRPRLYAFAIASVLLFQGCIDLSSKKSDLYSSSNADLLEHDFVATDQIRPCGGGMMPPSMSHLCHPSVSFHECQDYASKRKYIEIWDGSTDVMCDGREVNWEGGELVALGRRFRPQPNGDLLEVGSGWIYRRDPTLPDRIQASELVDTIYLEKSNRVPCNPDIDTNSGCYSSYRIESCGQKGDWDQTLSLIRFPYDSSCKGLRIGILGNQLYDWEKLVPIAEIREDGSMKLYSTGEILPGRRTARTGI